MADDMTRQVGKSRAGSEEESPGRETKDRMQSKSQASNCRRDATTESGVADQELERKCDNSSAPLLSLKMYLRKTSSSTSADSLSSSQQTNSAVDCAEFVLKCLFCRFYEMILMFPDSCKRVANHCCPTNTHAAMDPSPGSDDDSFVDFGCDFFQPCHEAGDCLELAMEVSQLCYH